MKHLAILALGATAVAALQPSRPVGLHAHAASSHTLPCILMKKGGGGNGKGFGAAPAPPPTPKKKKRAAAAPVVPTAAAFSGGAPDASPTEQFSEAEARGRRMLEEMRKQADTPVSFKPKLQLTEDELRPIDPTEGVMPEVVADRMLGRIIPFAAAPLVLAVFVFIGFYYANTQLEMDLPPQIVAYATQACLLLSFAGITYGVMSTNLDEEAEQSAFGTENLQRNLDVMRGAEDARIGEAKREEEEEAALRDGIVLSRAAAQKRKDS